MRFQHILFPVDFSPANEQIVPWVKQMADLHGARITLLHVWAVARMEFPNIDASVLEGLTVYEAWQMQQRTALEDFRRKFMPSAGAAVELREGGPAEQITRYAQEFQADLIMMPTHGRGRFRAALLGSVTAKVIHDSRCALWTSAHLPSVMGSLNPPHRVMCAVDDSKESHDTIQRASALANDMECSLTVVHAFSQNGKRSESEFYSRVGGDTVVRTERIPVCAEEGDVEEVVRDLAYRYGADLLVIGRGHLIDRLGPWRSHVYPIIRSSPCPVLTF